MNLLSQYLRRTICDGGNFIDIEQCISLGCPISPLMAAFFLHELDQAFEQSEVFYVRFMDDIVILAPTRWKLRRAVATLNDVLSELRLEKHLDKTYIERTARGFDFLGYHFVDGALRADHETTHKMYETAVRHTAQKGHRDNPTPLISNLWPVFHSLERLGIQGGLSGKKLRGAFLPALEGGDATEGGD